MRIVLTNDDGIEAPGLLAARLALEKVGDVITVAPDQNRSGVGRSISFGRSLHVEEREMADGVTGYACTGTPVDCVRLVALGLMDFEPDVVVSGINHGRTSATTSPIRGRSPVRWRGSLQGSWHRRLTQHKPPLARDGPGGHAPRQLAPLRGRRGFYGMPGEGSVQGPSVGTNPQRQRA